MSLFIENISEHIPKESLIEELKSFGDVVVHYFVTVTQGTFAFVKYSDLNTASKALLALNGRALAGRVLHIEYYEQYQLPLASEDKPATSNKKDSPAHAGWKTNQLILYECVKPYTESEANEIDSEMVRTLDNSCERDKNSSPDLGMNKTDTNYSPVAENRTRTMDEDDRKENCEEKSNVQEIGENTFEAYGSLFILKRINKHNDENSLVICEMCQREIKKKSIRSHVRSAIHKSKFR
jgi:RNA recognition motif-containing protein